MRCGGCGRDNPDDARFCAGCGEPQQQPCAACGRRNDGDARFCNGCGRPVGVAAEAPPPVEPRDYTPRHLAERILRSRTALEGERKQVTILFADVKSSTELAGALDPEQWHQILDGFFRILADGIHRFEGTINQYTGDGIMALFGAPLAHEDHAQRACFAARWLREPLRSYADEIRRERGQSFSVRMGIHSGEVVVGKIGDDLRMDYTAQGLSAALAQRMEQLAEPGTAYLTEDTAQLAEGFFELADLGEFNVKGVAEPVRVHRLEDVGVVRTRLGLSRSRGFSRFVGRERELEMLEAALARSVEGSGQITSVVGEAGVGKSRLCAEFVERCRARGIPVWECHCPSHGRAVPLLPVLQLTRSFFGISDADDPDTARQKIAGGLVLLDDALREDIPLACDFLGVSDPDRPPPAMEAEVRRRRLQDFVRRLVEARSAQSPALLLFDDLHWIDAESEAFVAYLASVVGKTRTFFLGNQRPEYDPPWKSRPDYQQIALTPLGRAEASELAGELLGTDPSVEDRRARLVERAGGNPFFTEELVRTLAEFGHLQGEPGAYRSAGPIDALELPRTVQAILAARIDRLGEDEKRLLRAAAVVGREASEPILRAVSGLGEEDLHAALSRLDEAGLLLQQSLYPVADYAFRHPLTHEVAYGSQLATRRNELHAAVARAFEDFHADSLDEHASLIAHHWDAAADPEQAVVWHRRAARAHAQRHAATSLWHWRRVRERLGELEQNEETMRARVEACTQILYVTWMSGLAADVETGWEPAYEEGIALAEQLGDDPIRASLLSGVAGLRGFRGEHRVQVELLEEALELARRQRDFAMEASLYQRIGWAWGLAGDETREIEWSRRGVAFCEHDLSRSGAVSGFGTYAFMLGQLGWGLANAGRLEEAAQFLDRAEAVSIFTGDAFSIGTARAGRATIDWIRDDREAYVAFERGFAARQEYAPSGLGRGMLFMGLATVLSHLEDWEGVLKALEAGAAETARIRSLHLSYQILGIRARAETGDRDGAETLLAEIQAQYDRIPALKLDNPPAQLLWCEAQRILYGAAAREEIEACCERIIEAARERGWGAYEPFARVERAELAKLLGDEAARKRGLAEAAALFRKIGAPRRAAALDEQRGGAT